MKKATSCLLMVFLALNGYSQITVNSNNNVGIKTTTPNEALEINGSIRGNISGALRINSGSGYLDIGAQNTGWIHIYTDRDNFIFNKPITLYNAGISAYTDSYNYAYDMSFITNRTQRMVIKGSSGYVGLGTSYPSYQLDVNGIIRGTNVSPSDARLKESVQDLTGALATIIKLKGVNYKLKQNGYETLAESLNPAKAASDTSSVKTTLKSTAMTARPHVIDSALYNRNHIGFIAQDIQKIYPELVYADKNGVLSIDYTSLIPVLVESIKEQQITINELKAAVEELKKKIK